MENHSEYDNEEGYDDESDYGSEEDSLKGASIDYLSQ